MIFVSRKVEPIALKKNKDKWLADYLTAINHYNSSPSFQNKRNVNGKENKYKQPEIKNSLKMMFADKCAYCESYIGHISYGHIEHFRPKAKYPKQCFSWSNLLLACEICNGSQYKGIKFPQKKDKGPFINPTTENPDNFLSFEYDAVTGTANVLGKNKRGDTTEQLLGLNRPGLIKHRSKIVRRMVFIAIKASQGDLEALQEIKQHIEPDEEYSAFAIELFKKFKLK